MSEDIFKNIFNLINSLSEEQQDAFTKEFINQKLKDKKDTYNMLVTYDTRTIETIKTLTDNLIKEHENKKDKPDSSEDSTTEKGKLLEDIAQNIFNSFPIFYIFSNIKNSSNEIDLVVNLNEDGKILQSDGLIPFKDKFFLVECKNYNNTVSVTWVGKFYSLINSVHTHLGILLSYHGFSGKSQCKGWNSASGLSKKIALSEKNLDDRIYILDFNIEHIQKICNGENLLYLIEDEIKKIDLDVNLDLSQYTHENIGKIQIEE